MKTKEEILKPLLRISLCYDNAQVVDIYDAKRAMDEYAAQEVAKSRCDVIHAKALRKKGTDEWYKHQEKLDVTALSIGELIKIGWEYIEVDKPIQMNEEEIEFVYHTLDLPSDAELVDIEIKIIEQP